MIAWLKSLFSKPDSLAKSIGIGAAVRGSLGGSPGAWSSDHRKEAEQYDGWNYVAIKAILKQCGGAECQVFFETEAPKKLAKSHNREIPENFQELPSDHRLVKLLKRPNPNESGATFLQKIAMQIHLTGSAYIVKLRTMTGLPVEMYVIPTGWITPVAPTNEYPRGAFRIDDFRRGFVGSDGFAEMGNFWFLAGTYIKPEDMIAIREPHPIEPCDGQSPVSAVALWSDTAKQVDQARWSHMKNGVNPSMVISPDKENAPTEEEATRATAKINQGYAGSQNAGKVIIAFAGSEVTPMGQTAEEMGYVGGADQLRNSILSAHGVPGSAAGITDGGSYAAFYANLLQFVTLTVQPLLNMIAEELARQLPEFGDNIVIWLTAAQINDPDILERQLATDGTAKSITKNEQRALRGLPPRPDGDVWVGDPPPPAPQPGGFGGPQPEKGTGIKGPPQLKSAGDCGTGDGGFKQGNSCGEGGGGGEHAEQHANVTHGEIAQGLKAIRNDPDHASKAEKLDSSRQKLKNEIDSLTTDNVPVSREEAAGNKQKIAKLIEAHSAGLREHLTSNLDAKQIAKETGMPEDKVAARLPKIVDRIVKEDARNVKDWVKEDGAHKQQTRDEAPSISVTTVIDAAGGNDKVGLSIARQAGIIASEDDFLTYGHKDGESSRDYAARADDEHRKLMQRLKSTGIPGVPKLGKSEEQDDEPEDIDREPDRDREDAEIEAARQKEMDDTEAARDAEDDQIHQDRLAAVGDDGVDEDSWDLEDEEREVARKREDMEREQRYAKEDAQLAAKRAREDSGESAPQPARKSLRAAGCEAIASLWRNYP